MFFRLVAATVIIQLAIWRQQYIGILDRNNPEIGLQKKLTKIGIIRV